MTIRLTCPLCNQAMQLPETAVGKRARCPHCKDVISVPEASATMPAASGVASAPRPISNAIGPNAAAPRTTAPQPSSDLFRELPATSAARPAATQPAAASRPSGNPYAAASNPYAAPTQTYAAPAAVATSGGSTYGPGLSLMILSGIHLALIFIGLIMNVISWVLMASDRQGNAPQGGELALLIVLQLATNAVALGIQGTVFFGGKAMLNYRNRGLAYAGAIIAVIPCIGSPLVIFGLPFGIWALVVLGNQDVQRRFR